jgi:hypothetical protein
MRAVAGGSLERRLACGDALARVTNDRLQEKGIHAPSEGEFLRAFTEVERETGIAYGGHIGYRDAL